MASRMLNGWSLGSTSHRPAATLGRPRGHCPMNRPVPVIPVSPAGDTRLRRLHSPPQSRFRRVAPPALIAVTGAGVGWCNSPTATHPQRATDHTADMVRPSRVGRSRSPEAPTPPLLTPRSAASAARSEAASRAVADQMRELPTTALLVWTASDFPRRGPRHTRRSNHVPPSLQRNWQA